MGFYHLYQAANVAAMCHEASGNAVGGAQGGSFGRTRDEAATFLHASRNCHALLDQDDAALAASCRQWLERAKAFVERTRAQEARVTNLQYARMPEQQDPSIVCKDGRSWKR